MGHLRDRCNSCAVAERRLKIKLWAVEYLGGKCIACGYNRCIQALVFHHINPSEKEFRLSNAANNVSLERYRLELDKCVLLCANCHQEVHAGILTLDYGACSSTG